MCLSWSMQVFLNIYKRVSYILYLPGFSSRRGLGVFLSLGFLFSVIGSFLVIFTIFSFL